MEAYMKKIQFSDDEALFDICTDGVFKSIFTQETPNSRGALNKLLSAILEKDLKVISISANEPPIKDIRERQIRFDINVEFTSGQHANVEITVRPNKFETLRMEYYVCKLLLTQGIKGKNRSYRNLEPTYHISIIEKEKLFDDNKLVHWFEYYDRENKVPLGGRTAIITLELQKAGRLAEKPIPNMTSLECWSLFFRYFSFKKQRALINELLKYEEGITMAGAVVKGWTQEEIEAVNAISQEKREMDLIMYAKELKLMERIDRKVRKAEEKGLIKGQKKGLKEGHEDVLALLDQGYTAKQGLVIFLV
jgi:predicted transposase/invertase (TIGR01784 family)